MINNDLRFKLSVTFNTAEKQERYLRRCLQTAFDQMIGCPTGTMGIYEILTSNYERIKHMVDTFDGVAYEQSLTPDRFASNFEAD